MMDCDLESISQIKLLGICYPGRRKETRVEHGGELFTVRELSSRCISWASSTSSSHSTLTMGPPDQGLWPPDLLHSVEISILYASQDSVKMDKLQYLVAKG